MLQSHHFRPFEPEWEPLMVRVNRTLFKMLIGNLVRNAEVHGFDTTMEGNKVYVSTSCIQKEDRTVWVMVDCFNNGKPLPDDFTFDEFIQFGSKGADSKGTGVGGFLSNRIVQNFEGNFRLLETDEIADQIHAMKSQSQEVLKKLVYGDRPFLVGFRIELPFSFENNETVN
jgi:nitrogen fixation/metabolism regulation signal transduction histidine kinase